MKRFADMYDEIDRTTSTNAKVAALGKYLNEAPPSDAAWALFFLTGRRLKRHVPTRSMHEWTVELTGLPEWLVEESYSIVGDFAEAIALLVDGRVEPFEPGIGDRGSGIGHSGLRGSLPFDVPAPLVVDTRVEGITLTEWIEHRLMGNWEPSAEAMAALVAPESPADDPSRPYPFCLASPFEGGIDTLGDRNEWLVEWKWDGIRAQLLYRGGQVFLWSRGEELITERFPEIATAARALPDGTVLDGEILAFEHGVPRPFADLQHRIGRQQKVREVAARVPVVFLAYDVLEFAGNDIRNASLRERRARLLDIVEHGGALCVSEEIAGDTWQVLAARRDESRTRHVEGLMLKRWSSLYRPGRRRGDWWKWKIDPFTVDAVLIYAQPGSGRRASLFTDYTFGVWDGDELVPIAKAYSGLSDEEIDEVDRWVRRHTTERFGPVSAVDPVHVFELGFERIARSTRHKSGVAVRFPRILRWRRDKSAHHADTLETLQRMIP